MKLTVQTFLTLIVVRQSLMSMSSKAGSVLVWYQGWAARRSSASAGSWP
jgi:hypothetical protein